MKIKIDVIGWDAFTGNLGTVPFENGVSTRDVTQLEMNRLGANLKIVSLDTDLQVGISTLKNGHVEAPIMAEPIRTAELTLPEKEVVEETVVEKIETEKENDTPKITKEDLEVIADKAGIKGIREIANKFDVKGVQISQLIEGILAAQGN